MRRAAVCALVGFALLPAPGADAKFGIGKTRWKGELGRILRER